MTPHPRSILVIRPSALGDVCRSVPIAVSLRRAYPDASIAWVVQDSFADAIAAHPAIDAIVPFPRGRFRPWWSPKRCVAAMRWFAGLRGRFDLVFDAQGLGRSGAMAFATRAPRRVGYRDAREAGWLGVNERYLVPAEHAVDRMLGLLAAAGVPPVRDLTLYPPDEAIAWWRQERPRVAPARYAVLATTSRWTSKEWPRERWRLLAEALFERGWERVVYLAGPSERAASRQAMPDDERAIDLAGSTTVGRMMAVIAASDLVVANDSAALHMAVGFDRPLLALFGPTDPRRVGPYGRDACVLQSDEAVRFAGSYRARDLDDRFMRAIDLKDVLDALDAGRARAGLVGGTS